MSSSEIAWVYYPRGFRRIVNADTDSEGRLDLSATKNMNYKVMELEDGDSEVNTLFKEYTSGSNEITVNGLSTPIDSWLAFDHVLKVAKRLIPSLDEFNRQQIENRRVHDYSFDFLTHLVGYVKQGRWALSPLSAYPLMDMYPPPGRIERLRKTAVIGPQYRMIGGQRFRESDISLFLRHDRGLSSLIEVLYVLFGK
tara:strand:- start:4702 stop:5292 length:591 start_codon:yes stop_codon:yes gene_type:complete